MTIPKTRRAMLAMLVSAVGTLTVTAAAAAATPAVSTAPGRIVVSLDGGVIANRDASGGMGAVGAVTATGDTVVVAPGGRPGQVRLVELTAAGALDAAFDGTGAETVAPPAVPQFAADQVVAQPDGKIVVVGTGAVLDEFETPQLVLVRLDPDGTLDTSFGSAGVDLLPIETGCVACTTLALRPGGGFAVVGTTGQDEPPPPTDPQAPGQTQWVVAGLTAGGALDPSFGQGGIATVAASGAEGTDVAALPDGDVVTLGDTYSPTSHASQFDRLLPSGAPDPAFHGGTLEYLPSAAEIGGLLAYPDGSVVIGLDHAIVRYTAAGLPDPSFGTGGIVQVGSSAVAQTAQLLPSAGDGALVVTEGEAEFAEGHDHVVRIAADGGVDPTLGGPGGLAVNIPFGGGGTSFVTSVRPPSLPPLDQNTFAGTVLQRADGSFELLGDVVVSQPTGEGEGRSIDDLAATALTSSFAPDTSFGGPLMPLHATLAVIKQRSSTALTRHGIRVTLNVSAPGLARVVIKTSGRVIAQNVLPVFHAGPAVLPVELTTFGKTWLRGHPQSKVTAGLKARDLLTNTTTATAAAHLR